MDPVDFHKYSKRLLAKLDAVIKVGGMAIIY